MGLLGDSIEDQRTMAVLRLAGALQNQRGGGFGGLLSGLNAGGQDYIQTIAAAKQQEEARKQEALKQQLLQQQIQERQAVAQQRQEAARQAQAAAQRDAQFTQDLSPPPITGTQAAAMPGGISPANAARIGTRPALDWAELARKHPDKVDLITKMAGMQDVGRREVARTVDGADEAGNPVTFQYSKHGDLIGTAIRKPIERKFLNTGAAEVAYNPYAITDGQTIKRTQSPDSAASNGLAWARLNFDKQKDARDSAAGQLVQDTEGNYVRVGRDNKAQPVFAAGPGLRPLAGKGAGMTEDQGKATGWLVQANNAYANMIKAIDPAQGGNPDAARPGFNDALAAIPSFGATSALANTMRSPERQRFMQSASSLSESLLRAATGAGVNKDEAAQKIQELTPVFGEREETTKQKLAAIPLYIKSLEVRAGPGAKKAASIFDTPAQPAGPKFLGFEE